MVTLRSKVHEILEPEIIESPLELALNILLISLIVANIIAFILETDTSIFITYLDFFIYFEIFTTGTFTIEYAFRLWSCVEDPRYHDPITGRLRWMGTFYAIIDFLAIAPYYLPLVFPIDLRILRILRLFRIFRILKLGRYSHSFLLIKKIFSDKKSDIVVACFVIGIFLVLASCGIYYAENAAQPDKFSSIPHSLWYAIVTMSTVGFVDLSPVTPFGQLFAILIAVLGIVFFALLAGIITSGYMEAIESYRGRERRTYLKTSETNIGKKESYEEYGDEPEDELNKSGQILYKR